MGRLFPGGSALDVIRVTQAPSINGVAPLTLSAWVNIPVLDATARRILDKSTVNATAGTGLFRWRINNSTILFSATLWGTTIGSWTCPTISGGQVGTWVHFAVAYNYGLVSDNPLMYINGVSQTVTRTGTPAGAKGTDSIDLTIGNDTSGAALCFNGTMAEIAMFNNQLSGTRVASLAAGMGVLNFTSTFGAALQGYWPLCGSSPELDYSGNGNNGAVSGTLPVPGPPGVATVCTPLDTGSGGSDTTMGVAKSGFAAVFDG